VKQADHHSSKHVQAIYEFRILNLHHVSTYSDLNLIRERRHRFYERSKRIRPYFTNNYQKNLSMQYNCSVETKSLNKNISRSTFLFVYALRYVFKVK